MILGGTYDDTEKEIVKRKIQLAEKQRQEKIAKEEALKERQRINNNYITALRNGLDFFPVFSDEWCFCQKELPQQLYLHSILNGLEVM